MVELRGVEPPRPACKAGIMPLDHSPERKNFELRIADFEFTLGAKSEVSSKLRSLAGQNPQPEILLLFTFSFLLLP